MMNINPKFDVSFMTSFNETIDALRMDYFGGDDSMLFMLPGGMGSAEVEDPMDIIGLDDAISSDFIRSTNDGLNKSYVSVSVPKFSMNTGYDLVEPLENLGFGPIFDPNADLTGMMDPDIFIDDVFQKALINLDETGTEAAAATVVSAVFGGVFPSYSIILDSPFIFLIQDNETGLILFMGRVMDPT